MIRRIALAFSLCCIMTTQSALADKEDTGMLDSTIDYLLTDIKQHGVDALLYDEASLYEHEYELMFAKAYNASVKFLAYGVNVESGESDSSFKAGVRIHKIDTELKYRRNDIRRADIGPSMPSAGLYVSFKKQW